MTAVAGYANLDECVPVSECKSRPVVETIEQLDTGEQRICGGLGSGGTRAFSPREREPMLWDNWTMKADGGTGGHDVVQPSSWLLAYWMGRYHGFIEAPKVAAPALINAERRPSRAVGAKPYSGPPRPGEF